MQVRDIMTVNPACCTPDTPLQDVARMMEQNDCGLIPVVDNRNDMNPVGTITDRDITIRTVAAGVSPVNMKASEVMTTNLATVTPEMSMEECFDVMEDREIRRVLVVDGQGRCCGIVAQADVVQSDANPARTNKVIREISESAPSRNQSSSSIGRSNWFDYRSGASGQSVMGGNSLVLLLLGLGSGVALTYLWNSWRDASYRDYDRDVDSLSYGYGNRIESTSESVGKYADAEQEIEKRQHRLEDQFNKLRTEPKSPISEKPGTASRGDEPTTNAQSRSAGQGNH